MSEWIPVIVGVVIMVGLLGGGALLKSALSGKRDQPKS
jgi:hypothetical protein